MISGFGLDLYYAMYMDNKKKQRKVEEIAKTKVLDNKKKKVREKKDV